MTRTHIILLIECTLFLLLCSCNGQKGERSVKEIKESIVILQPDTTVYATLRSITRDSLRFTSEYGDREFSCAYHEAEANGMILGSLTESHRYGLLINPNEHTALKMFNLTELSGQWFYDKHEGRGFTFTTAGALSSINPKNASFKKWKLHNGRLILYYTGIEDIVKDYRQYQSDTTEIEELSADKLVFRFRGETLTCSRQRETIKFQL